VSTSSSGGARSTHGRNSSIVIAVDRSRLVQVLLVHGDGAVVGVHGDLSTCGRGGSVPRHGGCLSVDVVQMVKVIVARQTMRTSTGSCRRGEDTLLGGLSSHGEGSSCGGRGNVVLVVSWDMASASRACHVCRLLVRENRGVDQIGI